MDAPVSLLRRREEHSHCIVTVCDRDKFLVQFVKASITAKDGHIAHTNEPCYVEFDFPPAKKAAIIAIENLEHENTFNLCMGNLTARYDEYFDPKYQFINDSNSSDKYVDHFIVQKI